MNTTKTIPRSKRNKTLTLTEEELRSSQRCLGRDLNVAFQNKNQIIQGDFCELAASLPSACVDLAIVDPPYNLSKIYDQKKFKKTDENTYIEWLHLWLPHVARSLKPRGSIYVCSDWESSSAIHTVLKQYFKVRNRITWERDKGRGALKNWKNNGEDIWFCTQSDEYTFNLDAVKVKKKVIAPYRDEQGAPKIGYSRNQAVFV